MNATLIWVIAAILLFVVEIITPGFVLACFGVGALVACLPALVGLNIVWQVIAFAMGSLLALFLLPPLLQKLSKNKQAPTTGVEALIGKRARVVRPISSSQGGRIAIDGDEWPAKMLTDGVEIPQGDFVQIVGYDSIVLVVEPIEK